MRWIPFHALPDLEQRLRQLVDHGSRTQQRDALAMLLGLHGLRVQELCSATIGDLDTHASLLFVQTLKKGRPRTVRLHPSLVGAILRWRRGAQHEPLLFTRHGRAIFPSHLQRFARKITSAVFGLSYRFHACRHTFAMRAYAQTKDLLLVRKLLGHRWITSTQIYAEALDEMPDELLLSIATEEDNTSNSSSSSQDHACRKPSTESQDSRHFRLIAKGA